jgi:hypothetical protein
VSARFQIVTYAEELMRRLLARPSTVLLALALTSCAHGGGWRSADLDSLRFDGENPTLVRVVAAADTVQLAHPVVRGDSLVGKYGHGHAVALESIGSLEEYGPEKAGVSIGGAIALTVVAAVAVLGVLVGVGCAGDSVC